MKKKVKLPQKPAQAPLALKWGNTLSAFIILTWAFICLYFFSTQSQFFAILNIMPAPEWLTYPEKYFSLLRYFPQFALLGLIAVSAIALGSAVLKLLKAESDLDTGAWLVFSCAAGLGLLSYITLAAGVVGALSKPTLFSILLSPLILLYFQYERFSAMFAANRADIKTKKMTFSAKVLLALLAFSAITALFGALAPEIFFDALFYHLGIPNHYLMEGRITAVPWNLSSSFPYLMHMLYVLSLGVSGPILAKLMHYFTGLLLMAAMFSFGKRFSSTSTGILAAAIFFTTPMVMMNWCVAGVELASALYTFTAVYAMTLFFESTPQNRTAALIRAAVFTGLACSTKYPAFFTGIAGLIAMLIFNRGTIAERRPIAAQAKEAVIFLFVTFSVVSPWLIKNIFFFGNPFYPFLGKLFGGIRPDPEKWPIFLSDGLSRNLPEVIKHAGQLWQLVIHPWQISVATGLGNADFIGIVYLALLALPFAIKQEKSGYLKYLIAFTVCLWISWFSTTRMPRYFIPALSLLSMIYADVFRRARLQAIRLPLAALLGMVMFLSIIWTNYVLKLQDGLKPVFGIIDTESYLGETHASYPTPYYQAMTYINSRLPADSRVLFAGETRSLYCARRYIAPSVHDTHPLILWARTSSSADDLHKKISENGVTHIFLNLSEAIRIGESYKLFQWDPRTISIFGQWWEKHIKLVWQYDGRTTGGSILFVYEITDQTTAPTQNFFTMMYLKTRQQDKSL